MKILISGNYGLSKNIKELFLLNGYEVSTLSSSELSSFFLKNNIYEFDVFINSEYKDRLQTELFEFVYDKWKYEKKTIINILTSALIFDGPNKKYIDDKKDLENKTIEMRTSDKEVRIINVYPNTLESTITATNQKLNYSDVSNIIKYAIELPHDIELFEIGISKTKLKIEQSLI